MATLDLGLGLRVLVITLCVSMLMAIGAVGGITWLKSEQNESTIKVINNDSIEVLEISEETKESKAEYHEQVKEIKMPLVDSDGYVNPEFMQLMESARSDALERGNESGIIARITSP